MLAEYAYINERLFHIFRGMWLVELYPYENVDLFCTHNMLVSIIFYQHTRLGSFPLESCNCKMLYPAYISEKA